MLLSGLMQVGVHERCLDEPEKQGQARQNGTRGPHRTFAYNTSRGSKSQSCGTSGRYAVADGRSFESD
jgi:hypothetical protein